MWNRFIGARAATLAGARRATIAPCLALAFSLLAVGDALAQDDPHQPHQGMHGQGMHGQMMMMGMMESPQMALQERERLDLSEDPVRQLESVQERLQDQHAEAMDEMEGLHGEIEAATDEDFDEDRARTALQQIADMHVEMGVSMLEARHETREVLTDEQQQQLAEVTQEHMRRMMDEMAETHGMMPGMQGPEPGAGPDGSC